MNEAKIRLSEAEMELAENAELILTKNAILQKVMLLLGQLQELQQEWVSRNRDKLSSLIQNSSPKISRGENYRGLPYLVLDYPRYFEKDNLILVRSMFWWGNFFSITLHLSGSLSNQFAKSLISQQKMLAQNGYYLCVNEDPWQHHFSSDNYKTLREIDPNEFEARIAAGDFIKVAKTIPLRSWDNAVKLLFEEFRVLTSILCIRGTAN